jgi:hypothetical protein
MEANDLWVARKLLSKYDLPTDRLDETELWCVRSDGGGVIGIAERYLWYPGDLGKARTAEVGCRQRRRS